MYGHAIGFFGNFFTLTLKLNDLANLARVLANARNCSSQKVSLFLCKHKSGREVILGCLLQEHDLITFCIHTVCFDDREILRPTHHERM